MPAVSDLVCVHYLCSVTSVLQMVLEQLGGSVLEGFGKGGEQHGELWSIELEQCNEDRLCCL